MNDVRQTEGTAVTRTSAGRGRALGRWVLGTALVLLALVVLVRLVADPLATRATRAALAEIEGHQGWVDRVHVSFFPPGSVVEGLTLKARGAGPNAAPVLHVRRAHSRVFPLRLLAGVVELDQRVEGMKITLAAPLDARLARRGEELVRRVPGLLGRLPRARVDRLTVEDSELLLVDTRQASPPRLWLHDLTALVENLVTRPDAAGGRSLTAVFAGKVQKSGRLKGRLAIPQGGHPLTFELRTALEGLPLRELHGLVATVSTLAPDGGTLSTYAALSAVEGQLSGWVRPVMDDVEIAAAEPGGTGDRVKAWLADKSIELFSDEEGREGAERERLSIKVPVRGRIDPDRPIVASLMEVMKRSLGEGLRQALPGGEDDQGGAAPASRARRAPPKRR